MCCVVCVVIDLIYAPQHVAAYWFRFRFLVVLAAAMAERYVHGDKLG